MRIGLVINILNEEYQISIFKGIRKRTEELGIELLCFQDENFKLDSETLTGKFPGKDFFNLDGIIVLGSSLSDADELKNKETLQKIWGDIPIVSIGQKIDNVPSFLIQTDDSMRSLVSHLINHHKYRHFVYLSGPQTHYDARKRERIFIKTMEDYKESIPELQYVIKAGSFDERQAIEEMEECQKEHPDYEPDVVVCANDSMAIGVYKFFKINSDNPKIKECAVTGFDDIPKGRFALPSLTTIHQPLAEIGDAAVDAVVKLIKKYSLAEEHFIESKLVLRNSCGCKTVKNLADFAEELQKNYVNSEELLMLVSNVGQDLNYSETEDNLKRIISQDVEQLEIDNFCVLRFPHHTNRRGAAGVDDMHVKPIYVKRSGVELNDLPDGEQTIGDFFTKYMEKGQKTPRTLCFKFLTSGNIVFGFILYDAPEKILQYVIPISTDIAQALARIEANEERRRHSEYLEKEVSKRTQELIESNNKRMQVEAEVLKISELERQRFSTDLHDDICQRLAGISMLCRSYSNQQKPVEKAQMDELADLISETLQTTRQYAHNSYPVELESLGMDHSINNLCNSFENQSGINCVYEWELESDGIFDKLQKLNIFRIIQEALHNVMKHSKAENVYVSVKQNSKGVIVQIKDDGCGFNSEQLDSNGIGLNSMQYRANQIGATFNVKTNKPKGTCIEVTIK